MQQKVVGRKDTIDLAAPSQPNCDSPSAVKTSWRSFLDDAKVFSLSLTFACACMLSSHCANSQRYYGVGAGRVGVSRDLEIHGDVRDHRESQANFQTC